MSSAIRVGTAPVSWGVLEVEGWGENRPYGDVLDEMVQAGYAGTELGPYGFLPTDASTLVRELRSRGLELVAAFVPLPLARANAGEASFQDAIKVMDLLAAGGAAIVVLADEMSAQRMAVAGRAQSGDALTDPQWKDAAAYLERVARAANARGLRAAFHHHGGTFVETPAEVERLLELTDPSSIGLCFDTGHYYLGGGDPVELARQHATRIWHLHWKDVDARVLDEVKREGIGYLEAVRRGVFCELGKGAVDFRGVMRALEAGGYRGWSIFEQDVDPTQPGVNPAASAARSRSFLRDALGI